MNILVVDDNRLLNRFMTTYLRGKGHVASSLTNPAKALPYLDLNPTVDAIIIDDTLPKPGGTHLITEIRKKSANVIIVVFSAGYDEDLMQQARAAGANGWVSKNLGPSEIYSTIMKILATRQAPRSMPVEHHAAD